MPEGHENLVAGAGSFSASGQQPVLKCAGVWDVPVCMTTCWELHCCTGQDHYSEPKFGFADAGEGVKGDDKQNDGSLH